MHCSAGFFTTIVVFLSLIFDVVPSDAIAPRYAAHARAGEKPSTSNIAEIRGRLRQLRSEIEALPLKQRAEFAEELLEAGFAVGRTAQRNLLSEQSTPEETLETYLQENATLTTASKIASSTEEDRKVYATYFFCLDFRLKDHLITGDLAQHTDIIRTAGAALSPDIKQSLALSVLKHRPKILVILGHSDCAAVKLARVGSSAEKREFPAICECGHKPDEVIRWINESKDLANRVKGGDLLVVLGEVDTRTNRLQVSGRFTVREGRLIYQAAKKQ